MLRQVAQHIATLEKRFFEEENSDNEEEEKLEQDPSQPAEGQSNAAGGSQNEDKPTTPGKASIVTNVVG